MKDTGYPLRLPYPDRDKDPPDAADHMKQLSQRIDTVRLRGYEVPFTLAAGIIHYVRGYSPLTIYRYGDLMFFDGLLSNQTGANPAGNIIANITNAEDRPNWTQTLGGLSAINAPCRYDIRANGDIAYATGGALGFDYYLAFQGFIRLST